MTLAENLQSMKQLKEIQNTQQNKKESNENKDLYALSSYQGSPKILEIEQETVNTAQGESMSFFGKIVNSIFGKNEVGN